MAYNGESIPYRYKAFPLHSETTLLCLSVSEEDMALIKHDQQLWANLIARAVKKHAQGKVVGMLKSGSESYVPIPGPEWNTFQQFSNDRPAENEENWPADADVATAL